MFGIESDIFKVFIWTVIGFIAFVALFFPLTQILPVGFHEYLPEFLHHQSLLIYAQKHLDFFLGIALFVVFVTLALIIWRKK